MLIVNAYDSLAVEQLDTNIIAWDRSLQIPRRMRVILTLILRRHLI